MAKSFGRNELLTQVENEQVVCQHGAFGYGNFIESDLDIDGIAPIPYTQLTANTLFKMQSS